jgi:hypothetical protein
VYFRSDKSPWTLDEDILKGEDELCGEIDIQDNSHIIEAKRNNAKSYVSSQSHGTMQCTIR